MFCLDNKVEIVFLVNAPDCLRIDRVGDDSFNVFYGLDSIINPSSGDLLDNDLLVPI